MDEKSNLIVFPGGRTPEPDAPTTPQTAADATRPKRKVGTPPRRIAAYTPQDTAGLDGTDAPAPGPAPVPGARAPVVALSHRTRVDAELASELFGLAKATYYRRCESQGVHCGAGVTWTIAEVHRLLTGSLDAERIREVRARAELLEIEAAEKRRDVVPMAEVEEMLRAVLLPIRQRLTALAAEIGHRANPSDPRLARDVLGRWVADSLPLIREGIEMIDASALEAEATEEREASVVTDET